MKKLLGLLGAIGLVATSSATVVACGPDTTGSNDNTDTTKGETINLDYVKVGAAGGLEVVKTEVQTQLNDEQKAMTPSVDIYAEGTVIALDETTNVITATGKDGQPTQAVNEIKSSTTYVYAITLTPTSETVKDGEEVTSLTFVSGNVIVGEAQQIVPQGIGEADENGIYSLSLVKGSVTGSSAQIEVENPDMVGTLDATSSSKETVTVDKKTEDKFFSINAINAGEADITISSNLLDVKDVTIHVTVTEA
ncbi:hypothetical protein Zmor_012193 [Zophobas morio]|uniref:Lipoprotein n=1 Tax=Zophobas morio TaxID=2755281 RepID=A0AA38HIL5_9CUCU|nr:hypothetical protein Zmor_012193 [Zophobas morio]